MDIFVSIIMLVNISILRSLQKRIMIAIKSEWDNY